MSGLEPRPLPGPLMQLGLLPVGRVASHMSQLLTLPVASLGCRLLEQDTGSCAALSLTMMLAAGADASCHVMGAARAVLESSDTTVTATVLAIGAVWGIVAACGAASFLLSLFVCGEVHRALGDIRRFLKPPSLVPDGELGSVLGFVRESVSPPPDVAPPVCPRCHLSLYAWFIARRRRASSARRRGTSGTAAGGKTSACGGRGRWAASNSTAGR